VTEVAREAVKFAEASDFLLPHAAALGDLAEVLELSGHPDGAAQALEQAIELSERKGNVLAADNSRARLADLR
jgi:hypothetical protein